MSNREVKYKVIKDILAKQIEELFVQFDFANSEVGLLQKQIKNVVDGEIPEWLVLKTSEKKKDTKLLHISSPIFLSEIYDSNTLSMNWPKYKEESSLYNAFYDEAQRLFIKLRLMKNSYINSLQKNPPRNIREYSIRGLDVVAEKIESQFSDVCVHGIQCKCGNQNFIVLGQGEAEDKYLHDPIALICTECKTRIVVFDSQKDGYDGVLENNPISQIRPEKEKKLYCPLCKKEIFKVVLGYEYSVSEDEAMEIIKENDLKFGPEELFTWINGYAKCESCNETTEFTSVECA